jgi:hypothetical protein
VKPKPAERREARRLRKEGWKLRDIAAALNVSLNSVHRWTRDIELSETQRERNRAGPAGRPQDPSHVAARTDAWSRLNRAKRTQYQQEGRTQARCGDPLHLAGCMLYWAEGAKSRNVLRFANSDGPMVGFFARFLRESLGVDDDRLSLRLNVYTNNGISIAEIERHWLDLLRLPKSCTRKHQLNHYPTSSSGKRRNLPYGVGTLGVARSTPELQHIFGAIQEYSGFDEPRWLDGPPRKPARPTGSDDARAA